MPYKLPSNLEPEGVECIKIYVPNDTEWRSLFWGAFSELARWFNYEKDGTEDGAKVARLWRTLYLQSETEYIEGGGCGMFDVRVKPDDSCILQKTTDGETWVDWANLDDCGIQFRVNPDGGLEWFDPATDTWKEVNTAGAEGGYDPLHDDPVQIPYPEADPDPETGAACLAAANAALGLKEIIDRLDTAYFEGNVLIWLEVTLVLWAVKLVKWITQLIMNVTQATTAYTYEEFHADYLEFNWSQLKEELHCFYDDNGVMSESQWSALLVRLGELEGTSLIWLFLKLIVQGVGSVGMTNGATHRYVETAECASCGQWVRYYRTIHSDWPQWANGQPGTGYETSGDYVPGSGWSASTYQSSGSTYTKMVVLNLGVAGMNLERIIVKAAGTTSTPSNAPLGFVIYDLQHGAYWTSDLAPDDTVFDITLDEAGSTNHIMIQIGLDQEGSFAALAGSGFVYDIELRGTGTAPTGGI